MTDSLGRRIDFKNTIIIMTSNIGARKKAANKLSSLTKSNNCPPSEGNFVEYCFTLT
jgi:ATP-dependent Clp protease ATP-binding subunit ClpA